MLAMVKGLVNECVNDAHVPLQVGPPWPHREIIHTSILPAVLATNSEYGVVAALGKATSSNVLASRAWLERC
jgi:hypothetical protein